MRQGESRNVLMNSIYRTWNHFIAPVLDPPKTHLIIKVLFEFYRYDLYLLPVVMSDNIIAF